MKVRLLKKVRKRYVIIRVDELASNEIEMYRDAKNGFGLPFYVLSDNDDVLGYHTLCFPTYEAARDRLHMWINIDYREKFRHKDTKKTLVWYPKQVKKKNKFKLF